MKEQTQDSDSTTIFKIKLKQNHNTLSIDAFNEATVDVSWISPYPDEEEVIANMGFKFF